MMSKLPYLARGGVGLGGAERPDVPGERAKAFAPDGVRDLGEMRFEHSVHPGAERDGFAGVGQGRRGGGGRGVEHRHRGLGKALEAREGGRWVGLTEHIAAPRARRRSNVLQKCETGGGRRVWVMCVCV